MEGYIPVAQMRLVSLLRLPSGPANRAHYELHLARGIARDPEFCPGVDEQMRLHHASWQAGQKLDELLERHSLKNRRN